MCYSLWPYGLQHTRLLCPSLSPGVCSNSCPLHWWCHPTTSSSVAPFCSCPQPFPASGSFSTSRLFFESGDQHTGASASASVLPVNIQGWFPLGFTGLISLQPKGLSSVFASTTIQKHKFFSAQPSLWSNSHIHTRLLEKAIVYATLPWTQPPSIPPPQSSACGPALPSHMQPQSGTELTSSLESLLPWHPDPRLPHPVPTYTTIVH